MALLAAGAVMAEEVPPVDRPVPPMPAVKELIAAKIEALPAPSPPPVKGGVGMAITAATDEVQQSVRDGLTCLHAGWDFEAYRHFVQALKGDADCLMANWGVGLALLHGSDDLAKEREAALNRMLGLVDRGVGTDLEHRYVFGLATLIQEGPQAAAGVFAQAAEEYPNDPQLVLLESLLGRGGFDMMGNPTPDQERAEKRMRELIAKHPGLSYLKYALLAMRAEAPDLAGDQEMVRELAGEAPGFAPYFHLLGHYEWRLGNPGAAQAAFGWAGDAYGAWMREAGLEPLDCPGWTKAEAYRAVALASKGDYESALAAAQAVAAIEVPPAKASSDGARMLLWEAKTLPARIYLRRNGAGDLTAAKNSLPSAEDAKGLSEETLAVWSFQAHSTTVGTRLAIEAGESEAARLLIEDLARLGSNFVKTRGVAAAQGEQSHWLRCFQALEVMTSELNGLLAMHGPEGGRGSAYNWFLSARDRQRRASLMMPPSVLLPMGTRLADYLAAEGEWDKALDALETDLKSYPNDYELLRRLETVAAKAGKKDRAEEATAALEQLKSE